MIAEAQINNYYNIVYAIKTTINVLLYDNLFALPTWRTDHTVYAMLLLALLSEHYIPMRFGFKAYQEPAH